MVMRSLGLSLAAFLNYVSKVIDTIDMQLDQKSVTLLKSTGHRQVYETVETSREESKYQNRPGTGPTAKEN